MKKNIFLLAMIFLFSCQENMPVVPDPPVVVSARKVLIEEFTGIKCQACPAGSAELENLLSFYNENLVVVSLHAGDFAIPYADSQYDFRTEDGEDLINYLGNPLFYPSAVVNRRDFDGGSYFLQSGLSQWSGFIDEEVNKPPKALVDFEMNYDPTNRSLDIEIFGVANEDLEGDLRVTVYVTESNIVDLQLDGRVSGSDPVPDYVHKHAFRDALTKFDGQSVATNISRGENYNVTLGTFTLPEEWVSENCKVIAFVSLVNGQEKEVLQAESKPMES
jgi:thiol-disulfide isomerase/thioredoxin